LVQVSVDRYSKNLGRWLRQLRMRARRRWVRPKPRRVCEYIRSWLEAFFW
jgi:hypothetical protein